MQTDSLTPNTGLLFILFIVLFAGLFFFSAKLYISICNELDNIVKSNSNRFLKLVDVNSHFQFNQARGSFWVDKRYDNKSSFNKIDPAYIMAYEIRNNVQFHSENIRLILENRSKIDEYHDAIDAIQELEFDKTCSNGRFPTWMIRWRENSVIRDAIQRPVVDCVFNVTMYYRSRKGNVNLRKAESFDLNEIRRCLDSVSRTTLDKKTYSRITAVERGEITDSLRYDILNRDHFRCVICGASAREGANLHVDHIVPVSKGGKSTRDNLRTLCERCNIGKSDKIENFEHPETQQDNTYVCPQCSGKLVWRNGRYGEFLACSNYPRCKYTRNAARK